MTVTRSTSRGSASATAALKRRTACEPPKMSRTRSPGSTSIRVLAATRSIAPMSRIGVPVTKHGRFGERAAQRPAGGLERDRERGRQTGRGPDGPARDDVAVPHHDRDAERRRGHQDGDRHVAAGREDRGRALGDQDRGRLRDRERRAGSDRGWRGRRPRSCAASAPRGGAGGCRPPGRGSPRGPGGRPTSAARAPQGWR